MLVPKTHCKDCPNRYPGCHDKCEDYKQARAEYEKEKAEEWKYREAAADQMRRILAAEKRTRKWKK